MCEVVGLPICVWTPSMLLRRWLVDEVMLLLFDEDEDGPTASGRICIKTSIMGKISNKI